MTDGAEVWNQARRLARVTTSAPGDIVAASLYAEIEFSDREFIGAHNILMQTGRSADGRSVIALIVSRRRGRGTEPQGDG